MRRRGHYVSEVVLFVLLAMITFAIVKILLGWRALNSGVKASHCLSNMKQLAGAALLYAGANDDKLPLADSWMRALYPHLKPQMATTSIFNCPDLQATGSRYGYAYNDACQGVDIKKVSNPGKLVILFESTNLRPNAHDALVSRISRPRNKIGISMAYADGSVRNFKP